MWSIDAALDRALAKRLTPGLTPADRERLEADPLLWAVTLFPRVCKAAFHESHVAFWAWAFAMRAGEYARAFVLLLARGYAKSSTLEMICVFLVATGRRSYVLTVSETEDQAREHLANIQSLLETPEFAAVYPEHSERLLNQYGHSKGWSQRKIRTRGGGSFMCTSLKKATRGIKQDSERPDFIALDDIDKHTDTPHRRDYKERQITKEILATGLPHTVGCFVQNVITEDGLAYRFSTKSHSFFQDAKIVGPIPALYDFDPDKDIAENPDWNPDSENPEHWRRFFIVGGTPAWPEGFDLESSETFLNKYGKETFLAEYQHDFSRAVGGRILDEWNPVIHLVTYSELARWFPHYFDAAGNLRVPDDVDRAFGLDVGATDQHPTCCAWMFTPNPPSLGAAAPDLSDCFFLYDELVLPDYDARPPFRVSTTQLGEKIVQREEAHGAVTISKRVGSHDGKSERDTLYEVHGISVHGPGAGNSRSAGIAKFKELIHIDEKREHPFLEGVMGRARFYVIVPDAEGALERMPDGRYARRPASTYLGKRRFRWEAPKWKWDETQEGLQKKVPFALHEDMLSACRYIFVAGFEPQPRPPSPWEMARRKIAEQFPALAQDPEKPQSLDDPEVVTARMFARNKVVAEMTAPDFATIRKRLIRGVQR